MSLNSKCETGRHNSAPFRPAPIRLGSGRGRRSQVTYAVSIRRQSPADQEKFMTALKLFLSETVRQHLEQKGRS